MRLNLKISSLKYVITKLSKVKDKENSESNKTKAT